MSWKSHWITIQTEKEPPLRIHYRTIGEGPPALLIHGWPTSSYLWRKMGPLLPKRTLFAIDLPGFGLSDKPLHISYSFLCFERVLEAFVTEAGIEQPLHLCVHDLGGPVGLYWAVHHPERIRSITLFNTLIYPELHIAAVAFLASAKVPLLRDLLVTEWGLKAAMKLGVVNKSLLTAEVLRGYTEPFQDKEAKTALLRTVYKMHPDGLKAVATKLPDLGKPIRLLVADKDKILPGVVKEFARFTKQAPGTQMIKMAGAGHFLQEEIPELASGHLRAFWDEVEEA